MTAKPAFEVEADASLNLLRIRYFGHVTASELKACLGDIEAVLPKMRPGFTVLTDLSGLDSMDLDGVPHLTKAMDAFRAKGVGTAVRIIPDPSKDIGFNILAIVHYRRGVRVVTCQNAEQAARVLKQ
ncbi:MAG TPA: hypothetical protein VN775_07990 [Opitutaceae bacterium]|nr:hypothetical protein [Opitutaceae bacterium]